MNTDKNILPFPVRNIEDKLDEFDLGSMSKEELISLFESLKARFDSLQDEEPDDPESPECLKWLGVISDIEDMMDDISELIER
ncbi:MAG: hypothetical protein IIX93_08080 [Clostridia bacterium]|nr:hypothetical protein [Clostridia bacterium]MBQ2434426.1 hypothetical protein [Clostridia bacterium]